MAPAHCHISGVILSTPWQHHAPHAKVTWQCSVVNNPFVDVLSHDTVINYRKEIFFHSRAASRRITNFCRLLLLRKSTSSQNEKMLSTMRKVCSTSARCLRPVVSSTSILSRNAHQAKAQAPSTSSGDDDLKLVNGKKTFSFTHQS